MKIKKESTLMEYKIAILEESDVEAIRNLERQKFLNQGISEIEISMEEWNSRWRTEYVEHYWKIGWSFTVRNKEGQLIGYTLAQPVLFFEGQTQSLWVDVISCQDGPCLSLLIDTTIKLGREKHLQRVYFPATAEIRATKEMAKSLLLDSKICFVKTTKG